MGKQMSVQVGRYGTMTERAVAAAK